jgi:hypothetical protein
MDPRTMLGSLDSQASTLTVQDALTRWHAHHPGSLTEAVRPVVEPLYAVSEFHGVMPVRYRRPRAPRLVP